MSVSKLASMLEVYQAGGLEVRPQEQLVRAHGRALTLTVREYQVLVALVRHEGRIITREGLFTAVWGGELRPEDRSVDVYVHKVRTKLAAAIPDCRFIHTHFGFGYRFAAEPEVTSISHPGHTGVTRSSPAA
jgi:DNA-binding response OmpR family regulator